MFSRDAEQMSTSPPDKKWHHRLLSGRLMSFASKDRTRSSEYERAPTSFLERCQTISNKVFKTSRPHVEVKPGQIESILPDQASTKEKARRAREILAQHNARMRLGRMMMLGFPINTMVDVQDIAQYVLYPMNNVGDPFHSNNLGIDSHSFELGVLEWFAKLLEIPFKNAWGYVTAGGTEGNLQGLYTGRTRFPEGIAYISSEAHYSIPKGCNLLRIPHETIPILSNGEMDYEALGEALKKNAGKPAIVVSTALSVFYGATDSVDKIVEKLQENGYTDQDYYIHADAAFGGLNIPFMEEEAGGNSISFNKPINSISISGHKTLGIPEPCGVFLTRKANLMTNNDITDLMKSKDTTLLGSRSGQSAVFLWYVISIKGHSGLREEVRQCVTNARTLRDILVEKGIEAQLNPMSVTVIFPRPEDSVINKWHLACEGNLAHVVVRPHCTVDILRNFARELIDALEQS